MAGEVSLLLQSILADNLTNLSSKNPNTPSRHVRKEGWTEVFGNLSASDSSSSKSGGDKSVGNHSKAELSTDQDASNIEVIQYRTSWTVQLLLRIYSIPHTVTNTPYVSNHCTGAYPQYRNLSSRTIVGNDDILPYLHQQLHSAGPTAGVGLSHSQQSEALCLSSLLDQLNIILRGLRYGDADAWENVYKPQCVRSSILHSTSSDYGYDGWKEEGKQDEVGKFWNGYSWYQAWAERSVALKEIKLGLRNGNIVTSSRLSEVASDSRKEIAILKRMSNEIDIDTLVDLARKSYAALDSKLARGNGTLQGTASLTLEDMRLFGHLAEALCDVNLVTVLADHENVIDFFQKVYQQYFGKEYLMDSLLESGQTADATLPLDEKFAWIKNNDRVNALNQFNRVPMNNSFDTRANADSGGRYKNAIEIMQTVALHCHDLQEVLRDIAIKRNEEESVLAKDSSGAKSGSLLHEWRMGGDMKVKGRKDDSGDEEDDIDDITRKNKKQMKQMMKEAKKNDEVWISGVLCATVIGLLASSNSAGG